MNFSVLRRPRTQSLLDGKFEVKGFPVQWVATFDPLGWNLPPHETHRDLRSGRFHGGEMSISSFIQAKSQGAPLVALPVFLKRGLVQRSIVCSVKTPFESPEQLVGKRVGLVGYSSSMAVWVRGVLAETYGVPATSIQWFALSPSSKTQMLKIPDEFSSAEIQAWEELDGYPHDLDPRERFLLSRLEKGGLDAVVSFQARIAANDVRAVVQDEDKIWLYYRSKGVYPINHIFVIREDVLAEFPAIGDCLASALRDARGKWTDYLPSEQRDAMQFEIKSLGADPFAYRLGDVEEKTLETFISYLAGEKMISHKLSVNELFQKSD